MRASEELWAEDITAGMVWLRGVAISPAVDKLVRAAPPNGVTQLILEKAESPKLNLDKKI